MIDYEKLQLIHKMYPQGYLKIIPIFNSKCEIEDFNYSMEIDGNMANYFLSADSLLNKLKELTQPKPKYEIGQEVWYLVMNNIQTWTIYHIFFDPNSKEYRYYDAQKSWLTEKEIYSSKLELIQAQIDHWTCLKNEELSTGSEDVSMESCSESIRKHHELECEHESDEDGDFGKYPSAKCKKCGEFY
jgi:hypothetical protein